MCGICGFTGYIPDNEKIVHNMAEVITHRGPDSEGYYVDNNISMGFRRLSIIDLDGGTQPIYNKDRTMVLTFNGEIYNYKELRKELIELGYEFYTQTDSETILHGYEEWGEKVLDRLRGMFGFAIYDTKDGSLFIARDFFGIKPIHYAQVGDHLVYGSEIKSILEFPLYEKKFNARALDKYLSFQYSLPPETFFEGIYCLLPGHYLRYKDGKITTTRYWEATFEPNEELDEETAVNTIEKVFEESVNAHKISDVEVGCFLSSGVDSSYVSTYFSGQKTFTVGFDFGEKYNEIDWAKGLSEKIGVEHHAKVISSDEFWDSIRHVQYHMDQPLADPSCIALYFVTKLASEYVKVVLSGEGADELFGGYTIYNEINSLRGYQRLPLGFRKALANVVRPMPKFKGRNFILRGAQSVEDRFIGNAFMFTKAEKQKILKDASICHEPQEYTKPYYDRAANYDDITKMQYLDINTWMVGDILLKADRMSMANSLELRVPFLDKEVFATARQIPYHLRVNSKNTKYAMRCAARRHMPEDWAKKKKLGFPVPTRVWLKDEKYYNIVKDAFQSETAKKFFNSDEIIKFLDDHFNGKEDNSRKVWTVYIFLIWYDIYFGAPSSSR
ncbi:MAG: asparagine synthase (glutamine-hydrolyzing) [Clostridia bacterium]|nr:asparagine synthase (glutamine-hydrolyzing) [Clostridia bacterium]